MRKKVTIELEIESDFESTIYDEVGQVLSAIEANDVFTINNVTVSELPKNTITLPHLQKEMNTVVKRSGYRPSYGDF